MSAFRCNYSPKTHIAKTGPREATTQVALCGNQAADDFYTNPSQALQEAHHACKRCVQIARRFGVIGATKA